ncbi:GNAT family N-acetyltransferase [Thalassobacillus devorans]|uniref:GNAT family N-acetyltransferase n=1 Tax=Thalassobacillus devorans TaxID=279813 RepID=UPI00048C27FA|nr:GNAT family N-acetyltransferase [Thalassobacillus devorans]
MAAIQKGEGKFFVGEDPDHPLAEITFREHDHLVVEHTYVSEELRGQGMAAKLVGKVADYAREEQKKVKAECDYAKKKLHAHPEYHDVLLERD